MLLLVSSTSHPSNISDKPRPVPEHTYCIVAGGHRLVFEGGPDADNGENGSGDAEHGAHEYVWCHGER